MTRVKISSKGQMVLPKAIREALGLRSGDEVAILVESGAAVLLPLPRRRVAEVLDNLPGHSPRIGPDEDLLSAEEASTRERWSRDAG